VNSVYANKFGLWDKVNTILIALMFFGMMMVALVAVSGHH
jgi:hypothetical protein